MKSDKKRFPWTRRFLEKLRKLRGGKALPVELEPLETSAVGVCNGKCKWEAQMFCSVCRECGRDDY